MGQLHQHLAVEDSKSTIYKSTLEEAKQTFSKREHLLKGRIIRQDSKLDEGDDLYDEFPSKTETIPVADTVIGKIEWVLQHASAYFDLSCQKDKANCTAKADLIITGKTILRDVPAITLLFIENKMKAIRDLISQTKTLDAAKNWKEHKSQDNVWETDSVVRLVKQPVQEWITAAEATDKHPAQVKEVTKEYVRATQTSTELSGYIPTIQKADLLMRCDEIIQAAKSARQTANSQEVDGTVTIAASIFGYLMNGHS